MAYGHSQIPGHSRHPQGRQKISSGLEGTGTLPTAPSVGCQHARTGGLHPHIHPQQLGNSTSPAASLPPRQPVQSQPAALTETHNGCAGPWLGGTGPTLLPQRQVPLGMGEHPWPQCRDTNNAEASPCPGRKQCRGKGCARKDSPDTLGSSRVPGSLHQCCHPTSSAGRARPKGPSLSP